MIAKAFSLTAIDMVSTEFNDQSILSKECKEGADLGFDSKQAIHPSQLSTIEKYFSPSPSGELLDVFDPIIYTDQEVPQKR
jgi:citrate lyase subunit beta-like protein